MKARDSENWNIKPWGKRVEESDDVLDEFGGEQGDEDDSFKAI